MDKVKFKKKWDNYWYYYKWHTVAAIFAVFLVAITVQECATKVDPDVTVIVATQNPVLSMDGKAAMEKYLQGITADVNGDGKKAAQVTTLYFSDSSTGSSMQEVLMANLTDTDNLIYVFDDATYDGLFNANGNKPADGLEKVSEMLPGAALADPYKLPVDGTKIAGQDFAQTMKGLEICVRDYGTPKNAKQQKKIDNVVHILKQLTQ